MIIIFKGNGMDNIMKRIIIIVLIAVILINISGCFVRTITLHEKQFDTLDELKSAAGNQLLYPAEISPGGFNPARIEISGYDDNSTWNYRLIMQNGMLPDNSAAIPDEGSPAITYFKIYAFAPRLQYPDEGIITKWPNMWEELDVYKYYEQLINQDDWKIDGIALRHYSGFSERFGTEDDTVPVYTVAVADGGFMRDGLLYMVMTEIIGHPGETEEKMLETADSLLETVVRGMLNHEKIIDDN